MTEKWSSYGYSSTLRKSDLLPPSSRYHFRNFGLGRRWRVSTGPIRMASAISFFRVPKWGLLHTYGTAKAFPLSSDVGAKRVGVSSLTIGKATAGGREAMDGATSTSSLYASPMAQKKMGDYVISCFEPSSKKSLMWRQSCAQSSYQEEWVL